MSNTNKLLTISIPTWNRAALLNELLESLVQQITQDDLAGCTEVLVSNNGSEDNTHEIAESFLKKYSFITYNKNPYNIGGNPNVMKSMQLASAEYLILLGDDDRLNDGSLKKIVEFLRAHEDTGLVIDSAGFKKAAPDGEISLTGLLRNYYWNIGNAGLFVMRSSFVKDNLNRFGNSFFNENWSQTQFMILGLSENKFLKAYINNLDLISHTLHREMTLYNSFYLWRGGYYELFIAIKALERILGKETVKPGYDYLKDNVLQFALLNVLQFAVFVDEKAIRIKTRNHIFKNQRLFSFYERVILWIDIAALTFPNPLARVISDIFIFVFKGKSGVNKKNAFVNAERRKNSEAKDKKSISVRKLEYEIDKY